MDAAEELWEERDEDQVESKERTAQLRFGDTLASSSFADDLTCPICMSLLRDPFATACGHTFCYLCLTTHLNSRSTCPSCATYLIKDSVFPNFMLSKVPPLLCTPATSPCHHLPLPLSRMPSSLCSIVLLGPLPQLAAGLPGGVPAHLTLPRSTWCLVMTT